MSRAIQCILRSIIIPRIPKLCYARYEKPLKNHPLDVAKKYVETYSSSNAAARNPEERAVYIIIYKSLSNQKLNPEKNKVGEHSD